MKTGRHQNGDVQPDSESAFVTKMKTSLVPVYPGLGQAPDLSVTAGLDLCPLLSAKRPIAVTKPNRAEFGANLGSRT